MGLAERVAHWTTAVVVGTTVLVGGGAIAWLAWREGTWPSGLVAVATGLGVVALLIAHAGARATTVPALRRLQDLARQVRRLAASARMEERLPVIADEEVAAVAQAVNGLLERLEDEARSLRAQAARGEAAVESSPNGVLVTDPDGLVTYVNPALRALVALRGEPRGRRPIEVVPIAEAQELVEEAIRGEPPREVRVTTGTSELLLRPLRVDGSGVLLIAQDVTRVREAERARSDFVANVSHELRTPIASIMGYSETLLEDREQIAPELQPMVEAVARNARRLRDLFEDLLELSRIEARRGDVPLRRARLLPYLEEAVVTAADLASQRSQSFELDCPDDLEAVFNPECLSTIVANLATNASNYTPDGGRLVVRAVRDGAKVRVEVIDDGIGIDRVHHERIFERFYRVDEGRSRRVGGTGLGLAIVKHLALASRSRVTVSSAFGGGSTFTIHLPEALEPPVRSAADVR